MHFHKALKITAWSIAAIAAACAGLYALIVWEGSSAREDAPVLEADIAQWLLHHTVPAGVRAMVRRNPEFSSRRVGAPEGAIG